MKKRHSKKEYEEKYELVRSLYSTGNYKLTDLEKITGLWYGTISEVLKKAGFQINPHGKISLNSDIFSKIDTEEKAYWLGFLYADGSIYKDKKGYYRFELGLKESDIKHIEKFKNFIESKHEIKYREKTKSNRISFIDNKFCLDLIKLGCIEKKSLILKFPTKEQVPEYLINHFIRGYFDGDGYMSKREKHPHKWGYRVLNCNLLGTLEVLQSILEIVGLKNDIVKKDKRLLSNAYFFSLSGDNARKFSDFLYKNATIYLERKKQNYESHPKQFWNKTVSQYDLNGKWIKDYYNGATAAKETGLSHGEISKCCYNKISHYKNFIFKFKNE